MFIGYSIIKCVYGERGVGQKNILNQIGSLINYL